MNDAHSSATLPANGGDALSEARRLAVLNAYQVLDTPPDPTLDTLTRLASRLIGVPVALVSLVDERRQWFKSRHGLQASQTPREVAFCDHVVRSGEPLVVEDALADPRFRDNPLVTGDPYVRFYAGVPLRVPQGVVLGTLCAIDHQPRALDAEQLQTLRELGDLAVQQLVLHQRERALQAAESELQQHHRFFENSQDLNCVASIDGRFLALNPRWTQLLGHSRQELMAQPFLAFVHPEDLEGTTRAMADLRDDRTVKRFRNRYRCQDGSYRWLEWNAHPTGRADEAVFASARDVSLAVAGEQALQFRNGILSLITDAQARFIVDGADATWWDFVLERLLELTGSEYGFIGTTESDASGPFLRTKSITNIAWDDATRRFHDMHAPEGMIFRNMKTLFGHAMLSQQRYLSNDVAHDPHAGGRPAGHPPLNAFAGLPIKDGERMVGLVGLANRAGGYAEDLIQSLDPLLAFLGKVLNELTLRAQQRSFLARLEASKELQDRVLEASETGFLALDAGGGVALANRRAREMLPMLRTLEAGDDAARGLEATVGLLLAEPAACQWALALRDAPDPGVLGPRKVRLRDPLDPAAAVELTVTRFRQDPDQPAGLLLALADLRQRAALEDTLRRNASLEERVTQLRQQQRDNEILSECVEYLQRCATLDEGMELVGRSLERLFPKANVALYAARDTTGAMVLRRQALRFGDEAVAPELSLPQCWALRTRRTYGSWPGGHHLACQHALGAEQCPTYCVPLFTLERNVALFSVGFPADEGRAADDAFEARMAQFVAMAQSVSGALSTIALRESLQRMALMDELTELSNRRAFELEVTRNIARHRRSGRAFAVAIVDVDHFKSVNDRHGHDAGDRVLQRVAEVLRRSVREGDLVARVGGEEFALFLSDLDPSTACRRLEATLDRLRHTVILSERSVTASVGFAHSQDFDPSIDYEALYKRADLALYRAKADGRDRVRQASASADHAAAEFAGAPAPGQG